MERERGERREGEGLEGAAGETARSTYGSNSVIEANLCAREGPLLNAFSLANKTAIVQ